MTDFYKIRGWPKGPWVPCEVRETIPIDPLTGEIMDRSTRTLAFIDGAKTDPYDVLDYGRPINKDEFEWLKAQFSIVKTHPKMGQRWKRSYRNPLSRR